MDKYVTEFFGTMLLVFTIGLAIAGGSTLAPFAIGLALAALVYMGGHVSGAQYNPAVALGALLTGKFPKADFVPYLIAQFAGGAAGAGLANAITGKMLVVAPGAGVSMLSAFLVEAVFSFMLVLVVLHVALHPKTKGNQYFGAAIGLTVCAAAAAGGGISGGAFNPAVGVSSLLVAAVMSKDPVSIAHVWLYLVAPCLGAMLAAGVFRVQRGGHKP